MSWSFPLKIPHAGETISYQDFNNGLLHLSALDGRLGEGNWNRDMTSGLVRKDDLAADVSMRVSHEGVNVDIGGVEESTDPSAVWVYGTGTWEPVLSKTVMTRGGELFITAGAQLMRTKPDLTSALTSYRDYLHVQIGIRIDGAVFPVFTIGDQDSLESGENMELGLHGTTNAGIVEGVIPVQAGQHQVELVVRALPSSRLDPEEKEARLQVCSRELLIVEIW